MLEEGNRRKQCQARSVSALAVVDPGFGICKDWDQSHGDNPLHPARREQITCLILDLLCCQES